MQEQIRNDKYNIDFEKLEDCKFKIYYESNKSSVKEKRSEAIEELRKLPIPGFRPGKATNQAIESKFSQKIDDYIVNQLAGSAVDAVLFETQWKTIGRPRIEKYSVDDGKFNCEFVLCTRPAVELPEYQSFEIPKPDVNDDTEGRVEKMLGDIRMRHGDTELYQEGDFVERGDQITLDIKATCNDVVIDDFCENGILYQVGNGWKDILDFDDNILGMMPDDIREFEVTVPVYGRIDIKVTLHAGTKKKMAALTDELAQKVGLENVDDIKEKVRVVVKQNIDQERSYLVAEQVQNRLLDEAKVDVPKWLLSLEAQNAASQSGVEFESLSDDEKKIFEQDAEKRVKMSLIFETIRDEQPEAVLSDEELRQAVSQQLMARGIDPEKFLVEQHAQGQLLGMMAALQHQYTLQWLIDQVTLID